MENQIATCSNDSLSSPSDTNLNLNSLSNLIQPAHQIPSTNTIINAIDRLNSYGHRLDIIDSKLNELSDLMDIKLRLNQVENRLDQILNKNLIHFDNSSNSENVKIHPNSEITISSTRMVLIKCTKEKSNLSVSQFVSKLFTSVVSVEDI